MYPAESIIRMDLMYRLSWIISSLNRKNLLKDYNEEGMSRITNEELLEMDARYWCRQPLKSD